jgi:F-box protein 3
MEEYAERLATGVYLKNHLIPDNTDSFGINLFPEAGPAVSVVTTNGIEAKASAIFVPESIRSCFTYSIRLRVASRDDLGYPSAQLLARHWKITDGTGHTEEVQGQGVVGKFPVLYPGGYRDDEQGEQGDHRTGTFVYQSCSGQLDNVPPAKGQFSGTLQFVPGSLDSPLGGEPLRIEVGAFPLCVPEFIF